MELKNRIVLFLNKLKTDKLRRNDRPITAVIGVVTNVGDTVTVCQLID